MAFTLAHPAAVIKVNNKKISKIGIILGSMAPDFEYFIYFKPISIIGHNLKGFILLNLPICIILYCVFYKYIKNKLILNLPKFINIHLVDLYNDKYNLYSLKKLLVFSYSAILGMFSHIVWDGFTHKGGYFVENISILNINIYDIAIFKYLQHLSTIVGFIIILLYILNLETKKCIDIPIKDKIKYWIEIILLSIVIFILITFIKKDYAIGSIIISIINSSFISLLIVSIIDNKNEKYKITQNSI